jgi:hypothetical protein
LDHLRKSRSLGRKQRRRRGSGVAVALARGFAWLLLVAVCVAGLRLASEGLHHYADNWGRPQAAGMSRSLSAIAGPQAGAIQARNRRIVYPYSVIPGGVESGEELHQAAVHDATVATHYAGFDYKRARVIAVDRPRLVYLSYRRGGQIYWSRKQASLHPGEKLLTDGRITARTRCGNRVSVLAQSNTSPNEPLMAELDRPDAVASGDVSPSDNFSSSLLQTEPVIPTGPASGGAGPTGGGTTAGGTPPGGGTPFGSGPPGVFVPFPGTPPISGGGGGGGCVPSQTNNHCNPVLPPPPVPEPGTVVLVLSGAAAVFARFRYQRT